MRGFNKPRKHMVVKKWVLSEKPLFGCFTETRVQESNCKGILQSALPGWNAITNYDHHHLGRIWFCWGPGVNVTLLHKSAQIITCAIQTEIGDNFICSAIYGSNCAITRRQLWADIKATLQAYKHLSLPWILLGDYNTTLASTEHSRMQDYLGNQSGMLQFQELVSDCALTDLSYTGALFTWWNKRGADPIGKKLDRALINSDWIRVYPHSFASFDTGGVSDHARCLVRLKQPVAGKRKPFKFFNYLTENPDFLATVKSKWEEGGPIYPSRAALTMFHQKLKALKFVMRAMNRSQYGDLHAKTKQAFDHLCTCQAQALSDPTPATFRAEEEASQRWHHLALIEEKFLMQKSRVKWLALGDQNSTFYHHAVQDHAARNNINVLYTGTGEVLTDPSAIKNEAVDYFQKFLQAETTCSTHISDDELHPFLNYRCSDHDKALLISPITPQEITDALKALPNGKAPGPDGYTKEFFIAAWPVVGKDFILVIQSFFLFGFLPTGVNSTILALIPKKNPAQTMKDYRPISCCNLPYKVISKILANRLKSFLPTAIEPNQSAFVSGRLLLENVLLATELVNGYHLPNISDRSMIKLDISKAFDTVKWGFLTSVLQAMGLPSQFIRWIYLCISTAAFSVAINGELEGFFTSARGIRQGCSLSPYLYVIASNVLSGMLNQAAVDGKIGYHPQCQQVQLTHLSFADDILIFTDGSVRSLDGLLEIMNQFAAFSGLQINVSKSSIFAAGRNQHTLIEVAQDRGFTTGTLPVRYLGMPLTTKAWNKLDYEPLIDQLRRKFLSWTHRALSFAGRLQLIKSAITSTINFWSSAFILPQGCLDTIESMCSAFLWSGSPTITHKAKVAWSDLCCPKEEGGLGIRRLRDTSRVFALNLIWKLFSLAGSFWVAWTRRYLLKDSSYWDAKENKGSWVWRKLLKLRPIAYECIRYEIKDGRAIYFWFDNWMPMGKLISVTGELGISYLGVGRDATLADASEMGSWNIRRCGRRRYPHICDAITAIPTPDATAGPDTVLWRHGQEEFKPSFSAKETWNYLRPTRSKVPWYKLVWFPQAIPRQSFIVWLAVKDRLSTGVRMRSWGVEQGCVFCGTRNEDRDHLFFACAYTFTVWLSVAGGLLGEAITPDWEDTIVSLLRQNRNMLDTILLKLVFQTTVHTLWRERNSRRHGGALVSMEVTRKAIDRLVKNRITSLKYAGNHKLEGLRRRWFEVSSP